jgi:hypothetical protein
LTDEEEHHFLASIEDLFAIRTVILLQPDLVETLTLAEGKPLPPLQQTQDNGLGQAVEVQQEVAG